MKKFWLYQLPKRGDGMHRGLDQYNEKFGRNIIVKAIQQAMVSQKNIRILEIGCGEGRTLMELRKLFPDIELYGINQVRNRVTDNLKRTGLLYNLFTRKEINNIIFPRIFFYNAEKLHFKDNYFDIVMSQMSIQYIARKDLLIEEVWRVLKKGGQAFLHIDSSRKTFCDFLNFENPKFIIYKKKTIVPLKNYLNIFIKRGFDIYLKKPWLLKIHKNTLSPLKLHLNFDHFSSFNLLLLLHEREKDWRTLFWGYRSVYRI